MNFDNDEFSIHLNFPKIDLTEYCSPILRRTVPSISPLSSYPGVFLSLKPLPFKVIIEISFFLVF